MFDIVLSHDKHWRIDVTNHFLSHLDPMMKSQMDQQLFIYDASSNSHKPFAQMQGLQIAYSAALTAETSLTTMQNIATKDLATQNT